MTDVKFDLVILMSEIIHSTKLIFGERLRKIIIYGSYARGDYNSDSDLDIMVLANFNESEKSALEKQVCKIASDASIACEATICMILNDEKLFRERLHISPFYRNVVTEGVEIYVAN